MVKGQSAESFALEKRTHAALFSKQYSQFKKMFIYILYILSAICFLPFVAKWVCDKELLIL